MHTSVEPKLSRVQQELHHYPALVIPEMFTDPAQLCKLLYFRYTTEEVLPFEEVHPILERVFAVQKIQEPGIMISTVQVENRS